MSKKKKKTKQPVATSTARSALAEVNDWSWHQASPYLFEFARPALGPFALTERPILQEVMATITVRVMPAGFEWQLLRHPFTKGRAEDLKDAKRQVAEALKPALDEIRFRLAAIAYQGYARATGGKTFDGGQMLAWADLPEKIKGAWLQAALDVQDATLGI